MGAPYPGWPALPPVSPPPGRSTWKKLLLFGGGAIVGLLALVLVLGIVLTATGYGDTTSGAAASTSPRPASTTRAAGPSSSSSPTTHSHSTTRSATPSGTTSKHLRRSTSQVRPAAAKRTTRAAKPAAVLAELDALQVRGRAPETGYTREQFGPAWTDDVTVADGHNGCDTRNDILRRDLTGITLKPGSNGCAVLTGTLHDTYTGRAIAFHRGFGSSNAVQIDHVVALADAWQTGAQQLTATQRQNLANDPLNLQAVDGPTNEAKGAGDAATWLPPNRAYRCTYVGRQVQVKTKYHLWVTPAEHEAIARVLGTCSNSGLRTPRTPVPSRTSNATPPATTTRAAPVPVVPARPTTRPAPTGCSPLSNGGHCYKLREFCAKRYRGTTGVSAVGQRMVCRDVNGWRWEPL